MSVMPISEVQAKLPELIHGLAPGEQVVITKHDLPVARLVAAPPAPAAHSLPASP